MRRMKVEFYGHVRQYRNIQKQIDANLKEVLLSGQYVMGPMLKRFEAAHPGTTVKLTFYEKANMWPTLRAAFTAA